MNDLSLYQLSQDFIDFIDVINESEIEEEDFELLSNELDKLNMQIDTKVKNIARYINRLDNNKEEIEKLIKFLQQKKKSTENRINNLKNYTLENMIKVGKDKIEDTYGNIRIQKNPPSVLIINEDNIPSRYKIVKQVIDIDKKSILNDLKRGYAVEGAVLQDHKQHLRIDNKKS